MCQHRSITVLNLAWGQLDRAYGHVGLAAGIGSKYANQCTMLSPPAMGVKVYNADHFRLAKDLSGLQDERKEIRS